MTLDHERLDVYQVSLEFFVFADGIIGTLPRGRSHLADQFARASTSILLNIAEGTGKRSSAEKRRYYSMARGSAMECGALVDALCAIRLLPAKEAVAGKKMIERIAAMLVRLEERFEGGKRERSR